MLTPSPVTPIDTKVDQSLLVLIPPKTHQLGVAIPQQKEEMKLGRLMDQITKSLAHWWFKANSVYHLKSSSITRTS
jgi:hypothetical protein